MATYSFTQPAAPSWTTTTYGTAGVSDTYILSINSNTTAPNGLWVINDGYGPSDTFQFNLTLDSLGRFKGPVPILGQLTTDGRGIWTFGDLRQNPLAVQFNGFDGNYDQIKINVYNSANQLTGSSSFSNFYRANNSSYDSDIGANVWDFTLHEESWGDGDRGLVADISKATSEFSTRLAQYGSALNSYDWIDVTFDDDAFQGAANLNLSSVGDVVYHFWLSANATNNQLITETDNGNWDTVEYSIEGIDSTGSPTFVSHASNLNSMTLNWSSAGKQVVRTLNNNGGTFTDSFTGIENFRLTNAAETINIDTRGLSNWVNVSALGGNDTFNIQTSAGAGSNNAGMYLSFGTPWYEFEKNGVFGNFTGESQTRLYKPTVGADYSITLSSLVNQSGSALAQVYDSFGGYDTVNFNANADVSEFQAGGSKYSDRFYVGDLGLSGAINQFSFRGTAGYDILRVTDEVSGDSNSANPDRINIVADYRYSQYDIQDPLTNNDIDSLQLKVFSGTIQKGDKGIYGIDRIQKEKLAVINSEEYLLNSTDNYLEWNTSSNAEQLVFQLGSGADRAYIKPLLSDVNDTIIVDFSEWMGADLAKDIVEIDFTGILSQIANQAADTVTKIALTGVESLDEIRFVNPSVGGMTRSAFDDGNAGTTNDADKGWTFTKTGVVSGTTYTHKVHVLFEDPSTGTYLSNSSVTALTANVRTVESRTVYDYPTYSMTNGVDNAILFEDAGYNSFHNFLGGDDFVILRDGNLDVVLGAGDDYVGVSANIGEAIVIGGTGNDSVGLYGLIGTSGAASDWVFTTMDVATARQVFADKYALNPTTNPFEIELSASGLEVVTVAQRYDGGTTYANGKYTGVGNLVQTVYLQAETVASVDSGDISVDSLYGSRDFSVSLADAGSYTTKNYYGRRGTEDSLTITLSNADDVAKALTNLNVWMKTSTATQASLNGSVLSGSHVTTLTTSAMGITGATSTFNLVDIERITVTGGGETATIRLAGSNGYAGGNGYTSVQDAVYHANYGDIIYVAKTVETSTGSTSTLMGSIANQTTIDIPAGLGIVFEPVATTTAYKVNLTDQMAYGASVGADRTLQLLGKENIEVAGSTLADVIIGNQGNNIIYGGGGNDVIYGGGGNDTLFGQAGADTLIGSVGNDFLNGGTGDDTLITYGTTRTAATTSDRTNMIGGSGDDQFVFLGGKGQHTLYGGSGEDDYMIMPSWVSGTVTSGTTASQQAVNGVSKVLDFSTVSDDVEGSTAGLLNPDAYVAMYNLTFNQLVSPPNPFAASYTSAPLPNTSTLAANADWLDIAGVTQNVGDVLENYGLFNDVNEYKLHQGVAA